MADPESSPIRPYHLWFAQLLLLIAVVFTLYGCLELWQARQLVRHGIRGQATVTDYKVFPASGKSPTMYLPVLRLVDPAGKIWQKDDGQSSNRRLYTAGQSMEVIYAPGHPDEFKTNTWESVWELGVVTFCLSAFACLLFYGLLVFVRDALDLPAFGARWAWLDEYLAPLRIALRVFGR